MNNAGRVFFIFFFFYLWVERNWRKHVVWTCEIYCNVTSCVDFCCTLVTKTNYNWRVCA